MPLTSIDELIARGQLAGLRLTQSAATKAYLMHHVANFDRVEFEVRVGDGTPPLATMSDTERADHKRQTQKRIDLVAWDREYPTLVEVKTRLDLNAMGQLLAYRLLWMRDNPTAKDPRMVAVGLRADPDVILAMRTHGIDVELYPGVDQ